MGRGCSCCGSSGSEECLNINSNFCTPWIIEYQTHRDGVLFQNISSTHEDTSFDVYIPDGSFTISNIRCPFLQCSPDFRWLKIGTFLDCYGRTNPYDMSASIANPSLYSYIATPNLIENMVTVDIKKICKLKKGKYRFSVGGFDGFYCHLISYNTCFPVNKPKCTNSDSFFYYPFLDYLLEENKVENLIIDGPKSICQYTATVPPVQVDPFPVGYPQNIKTDPIYPIGASFPNYNFYGDNDFTIEVIEDCFFYINVSGIKVSKIESESGQCICPDGYVFDIWDKIVYYNPESFSANISIEPLDSQQNKCNNKIDTVVSYKDYGFECH